MFRFIKNKDYAYLDISEISTLEIEPTSKCNLLCPQCARTKEGRLNPLLPITELQPEDYDKIFNQLVSLKKVIFNGNYGDFIAAKHVDYVIDNLLAKNISMTIFTNGSLRAKSWWAQLGSKLSNTKSMLVFSIDGIGDTNAIYRVNSSFSKIMENVKAYIGAGGRARWDFLIFEHNHHQLEEAKHIAKELGFVSFLEKKTARSAVYDKKTQSIVNSNTIHNPKNKNTQTLKDFSRSKNSIHKVIDKYGTWDNYINKTPIRCKFKKDMKALFIDFEASVWPCCWLGAPIYFTEEDNFQKVQINNLKKRYGLHFNSLRHHSLKKILSHPWLQSDLVKSWNNTMEDKNPKFMTCGKVCGSDYEFTSGPKYKNSNLIQF